MELAVYGLIAGLLYQRCRFNIYLSLVAAMVAGRVAFALALWIMGNFVALPYGPAEYFTVALVPTLPGIGVQILIIPPLILAIKRVSRH